MANAEQLAAILKKVNSESSFIQNLLVEGLGWVIDEDVTNFESISYDWTEEDLKADGLNRRLMDGQIRQIQPLAMSQPWGIFHLEFKHPDVFIKGRGMVGLLRKVLRGLIPKQRRAAHLAAWKSEDILFICTHQWEYYSFVHFSAPRDGVKQARLTSFGWGPDTHGRTVLKYNLPALEWPDRPDDADAWRKSWLAAFDKEALTRNFFKTFQALYETVKHDIASGIKPRSGADKKALILLNRLVFLYFIQKKGWLAGKSDFLITEFEARHRSKPNATTFYRDFIFPLFQRLSMPDCTDRRFEEVPFLNGGLFEIDGTQADSDLKVKNSTFAALFDELLEHYNFTASEDTPLDVEVAIDPEMLGKIFEELVTGRHESGAYYTPRPIVSFMCREALKGYLGNGKAVEKFVDGHDASALPNSEAVLDKLKAIRVCDPACGSGAYLVGMLQELMALRQELFISKKVGSKDAYRRKLEIIQNNLYGVDLDEIAINIARLRLWLSLVIEYDGTDPDPLPNLDFKIEQGDSLTGPDPTDSLLELDVFDYELVNEFARKKAGFLKENVWGDKTRLRDELEEIRQQLRGLAHRRGHTKGFDWAIEFAEVFSDKARPGFDVVLANPPYVRQELIKEQKPDLKKAYGDLYSGTADLYCYFYIRAVQLLAPGGMMAFISSNKWFRAGYGKTLRNHIAQNCAVREVIDFGDLPVFIGATAYPMIFLAQKAGKETLTRHTQVTSLDPPYPDVKALVTRCGQVLPPTAIQAAEWSFLNASATARIEKMKQASIPLSEYVDGQIYYGIKTGLNEAWVDSKGKIYTKGDRRPPDAIRQGVFVIDGNKRKELIHKDKKSSEIIKPLAVRNDISRWHMEHKDSWLIVTKIGVDMKRYPAVMEHLKRFQSALESRQDQGGMWWELRPCTYYDEIEKPKIVFPDISNNSRFAYDTSGIHIKNTMYLIASSDLYLLGILNSGHVENIYREISSQIRGGYLRFIYQYVTQIPIPKATAKERKPIEYLVRKCLDAQGVDCEAWEREIDERVAALYGL